jgi:hypothetical protein
MFGPWGSRRFTAPSVLWEPTVHLVRNLDILSPFSADDYGDDYG